MLLFVSLITFVLMHSVEGGPWDREKKLPDAERLNLLAEKWRPYRSIATWYLWRSAGLSREE